DACTGGATRPVGAWRCGFHCRRAGDHLLGGSSALVEKNRANLSVSCRPAIRHEGRHGAVGVGRKDSPVLAAGIAAFTSTIEIFLINRYIYREKFVLPPKQVIHWFVASGLFTGGAFLCMYLAFNMERVSIVAPLINSYAVFVLVLAPLMARRIEEVTLRKAAGAALVVAGIFLISAGRSD